jgi:hypothetical protein
VQFAVSLLPSGEKTEAGLIEVNGLPGGFMMIRRDCAERMAGAYRHLGFDPQDGKAEGEAWRGNLFNIFGAELSERTRWSEDIAFCRRWAAIGGRVWLDPHILLEHWGMARFAGHPAEMFVATAPAAQRVVDVPGVAA